MVVVRRFARRHERELEEVGGVVAGLVELGERLRQRLALLGRDADLVGVVVDQPVGVQVVGERLLPATLLAQTKGVRAGQLLDLDDAPPEVALGDLDRRVRGAVV